MARNLGGKPPFFITNTSGTVTFAIFRRHKAFAMSRVTGLYVGQNRHSESLSMSGAEKSDGGVHMRRSDSIAELEEQDDPIEPSQTVAAQAHISHGIPESQGPHAADISGGASSSLTATAM
ncbi:hypothetical protein EIP86_001937 [Pleurotus ostreatoroseus]|nr:hypothetical protein EIP86_001937 [Pleurotus ostreatoroseus]